MIVKSLNCSLMPQPSLKMTARILGAQGGREQD